MRLHTSIGYLQKKIHQYIQRRDSLRKRYNVSNGYTVPQEYTTKVKNINVKLKHWKKTLKVLKERKELTTDILRLTARFFVVNMGDLKPSSDKSSAFIRKCFCKYCLEYGIAGPIVTDVIQSSSDYAGRNRKKLNLLLKDSIEKRQIYHSYKTYIDENLVNL